MKDRLYLNVGWWLMGFPVGYRQVWSWLYRCGPYRWGSALVDRSYR